MGLFDKKFCDICGNKIGLLGNRKLDDGNLCKDCAAKLSPWFSERRHSTVAQISEQLAYREANKAKVSAFNATRTIGRNYKLLIDDNKRQFLVASGSNPLANNPDVLDFSQAMGIDLSIDESRHEKKQTVNGNQVSYNPPRYEYSYTFRAVIRVSGNPYFDDMSFMISDGSVNTGETNMQATSGWTVHRTGMGISNPGIDKYNEFMEIGNNMKAAIDEMRMGGNGGFGAQNYSAPGVAPTPAAAAAPAPATPVTPAPAAAPVDGPWTCPACGAKNEGGKFCEFCGTPRA